MLDLHGVMRLRRSSVRRSHFASHIAPASALGAVLVLLCANGQAESMLHAAGSPGKATARLDFRIVIPKVLRLDAATGALFTNARATETVLISTEAPGVHRTSASNAGRLSVRNAALNTPASSAAGPVSYTVTMP